MLKNIVLAILSLMITLGLYHDVGFFYEVFWVYCVLATLLMVGACIRLSAENNRDRVEGLHIRMCNTFTSVSYWVCFAVTVPSLLYTLVTAESWNTLAMYVIMIGVGVLFLRALHNKYKSMFSGEV